MYLHSLLAAAPPLRSPGSLFPRVCVSGIMKKPDGWKHEAYLRRILDADKFDAIVYFEEAVLADSATLQPKG